MRGWVLTMLARRLVMGLAFLLATAGLGSLLHDLQDTVPVVVTTTMVPAHTPLTADMLEQRTVHRAALETLAGGAVQTIDDAVGLVTRMDLPAGEVIRQAPWQVTAVPEGADPSAARYHLPEGMRLTGLRLDSQAAVGGRVKPGDRVDVIFTVRTGGTASEVTATTILQGVEVYSVGSKGRTGTGVSPDASGALDITLIVTPEEAQQLALAKRSGGSVDLTIAPPDASSRPLPPAHLKAPAAERSADETTPRS
jgi:pilus assembly protein CpaB